MPVGKSDMDERRLNATDGGYQDVLVLKVNGLFGYYPDFCFIADLCRAPV